jgi:SAM-dependent methyltransferase
LLARLGRESTIVGADFCPEGIELARLRISDPRASFLVARAQDLPFSDASFGYVVCHMALMLMDPLEPVLAEAKRVLKPGGRLLAVVSGGAPLGLYKEVRRLTSLFVQAHIPSYVESRQTRTPRLPGETREFQVSSRVRPEAVWDYMKTMYFVPMLPSWAQRELRDDLLAAAQGVLDEQGNADLHIPMKLVDVRL